MNRNKARILGRAAGLGLFAAAAFTTGSFLFLDRGSLPPFAMWWSGERWAHSAVFFGLWLLPIVLWVLAERAARQSH